MRQRSYLLIISLLLLVKLSGLSQSTLKKEGYPQITPNRDGVIFSQPQVVEIARVIKTNYVLQDEVGLYKELNTFVDSLNKLSIKEINKLDSLVINIDKKFGVVQKEYWKSLETIDKINADNLKLKNKNDNLKKWNTRYKVLGVLAASVTGIILFK